MQETTQSSSVSSVTRFSNFGKRKKWDSIRELVDRAMNDINLGKGEDFKYAHSDMAYSKQFNSLIYSITTAGEDTFTHCHEQLASMVIRKTTCRFG
jgi:hypothetical protein